MKIAVCGKGGSGKSTLVALLAHEALRRGYKVLAVDSDESNTGLFRMLDFTCPPSPLLDFIGGREALKQNKEELNIFRLAQITTADIPEKYILSKDGLKLVTIGKIMQSLEGCACAMGVLSREFLKKLALGKNELAIVDMEAGIEHFGRGIETSIDGVLIIVEPPLESINVGQKVHEMTSGIGISNVWAVLNKVPSEEIATRLKNELQQRRMEVAGCIYFNEQIFNSSLEGKIPQERLQAVADIFDCFSGAGKALP